MSKRIAIIGAGAKAAAIVARASVLRGLRGQDKIPEILVFEKDGVGASWSGSFEYTNGALRLCTAGEKDVGFPYEDVVAEANDTVAIAPVLHARFSWSSFLVAKRRMTEWVERGRQHPSHKVWSEYLSWVFKQAGCDPIEAEVSNISHRSGKWHVTYQTKGETKVADVDAVVLTGSGKPRTISANPNIPPGRVLDAKTFWPQRRSLSGLESGNIVVVGDGGAAGAILAWLAQAHADRPTVIISSLSPMGTLFPRGDGYSERRWFSDPADWQTLSPEHRQKLIDRTDAGVISMHNKDVIDRAENVQFLCGKGIEVKWDGDEEELHITTQYGKETVVVAADYLINAIGFDGWNNLALVTHPAIDELLLPASDRQRRDCEESILPNLSLDPATGSPAGLHVPALGVRKHGPGMSNLGCLGLMATAVLRAYIT